MVYTSMSERGGMTDPVYVQLGCVAKSVRARRARLKTESRERTERKTRRRGDVVTNE